VCNRLPQPKLAQFSVKMCVSQPDGLQAAMLTTFYIQVLDLGMIILVNVAVNPAMLSSSRQQIVKKNMPIDEENNATAGIQTITRSYLGLRVIGNSHRP